MVACVDFKEAEVGLDTIARQFGDTSSSWRESLSPPLARQPSVSVCRLRLATCQQPFRRLGVCTCCHRAVCVRVSKSTENVNVLVSTLTCQGRAHTCMSQVEKHGGRKEQHALYTPTQHSSETIKLLAAAVHSALLPEYTGSLVCIVG